MGALRHNPIRAVPTIGLSRMGQIGRAGDKWLMIFLVLLAAISPVEADQRLSRMTTLYERMCLKTFPDDKAIEREMAGQSFRELTPDEVKVTMRDDPARAWDLRDGGATLWIEFPPYHACSVRWNTPQIGDLRAYSTMVAKYKGGAGDFQVMRPVDSDQGPIHVHAIGEWRQLPNKGQESLLVLDQHITDPKRVEAGETGVVLRFVHQFASPARADGG